MQLISHLTDEKTEAQGGPVICRSPQSQDKAKVGLEPRCADSGAHALIYISLNQLI